MGIKKKVLGIVALVLGAFSPLLNSIAIGINWASASSTSSGDAFEAKSGLWKRSFTTGSSKMCDTSLASKSLFFLCNINVVVTNLSIDISRLRR